MRQQLFVPSNPSSQSLFAVEEEERRDVNSWSSLPSASLEPKAKALRGALRTAAQATFHVHLGARACLLGRSSA